MVYDRLGIQIVESLDAFLREIIRKRFVASADVDWRTRKIADFIDSYHGKVVRNLDDVSKQLGLAMSGRQARRVFRRVMGIGFKEYLKEKPPRLRCRTAEGGNNCADQSNRSGCRL